MIHDPKEVLDAMCRATSRENWDNLSEEEREPFRKLFTNALRAARDMGWKMVPREFVTDQMKDVAFVEDVWSDSWRAVIAAAPELVGE